VVRGASFQLSIVLNGILFAVVRGIDEAVSILVLDDWAAGVLRPKRR
jgi:hypothetical protein